MQIKYRITALYTLVVAILLLLFSAAVYYFASTNREELLRKRITNRAYFTGDLFLRVEGIDTAMLNDILESTRLALVQKSLAIYDDHNRIIYQYNDKGIPTVPVTDSLLSEVRKKDKVYFQQGDLDAVGVVVPHPSGKYIIVSAANDVDGREFREQIRYVLLACFLVGIMVIIVSGYLFALRLLKPIDTISKEMKEISSRNLSKRLDTGSNEDEMRKLTVAINDLLNRLQTSFEIQGRFIANASHELSTPLTSISSQLEVAIQKERTVNAYQNVIRSVYEDVQNMNNLTRTLLDMAKASGSPSGLILEPVRMDELLMELPGEMKKIDKKALVHLQFQDYPDDEQQIMVQGNRELIFCALKNLVSNACKYSGDHTAFIILSFEKNDILIAIKDNGKGISRKEQDEIFQPFFRGHAEMQQPGFGLGLSLASRIIKLHKGAITVVSDPGKGSVFTIVLPSIRDQKP